MATAAYTPEALPACSYCANSRGPKCLGHGRCDHTIGRALKGRVCPYFLTPTGCTNPRCRIAGGHGHNQSMLSKRFPKVFAAPAGGVTSVCRAPAAASERTFKFSGDAVSFIPSSAPPAFAAKGGAGAADDALNDADDAAINAWLAEAAENDFLAFVKEQGGLDGTEDGDA
jgi:hypothetical protein